MTFGNSSGAKAPNQAHLQGTPSDTQSQPRIRACLIPTLSEHTLLYWTQASFRHIKTKGERTTLGFVLFGLDIGNPICISLLSFCFGWRITDDLLNVTSTSYLYSATYPGRRFSNIQTTQSPDRYQQGWRKTATMIKKNVLRMKDKRFIFNDLSFVPDYKNLHFGTDSSFNHKEIKLWKKYSWKYFKSLQFVIY